MNKLLVICGPTSTGKTTLALKIAKKLNGEIVSADSRQVYVGMNIGTGKDLPMGAKLKKWLFAKWGSYEIDGVKIWGYDLVDPRREFSVAQYLKIAHKIIDDIARRGKLPILTGGTGLYIKGVVDGIQTADVPKNDSLRTSLDKRSVDELYETLANLDSMKAASLNASDRRNPRRLIRAIEVAQYQLTKKNLPVHHVIGSDFKTLFIGLNAPKGYLDKKIEIRVKDRVGKGIKDEIRKLLRMNVDWSNQSMVAMGYGQWRDYFEGGVPEEQVLDEWSRAERSYAKRQMTWFKKDPRVKWFDITDKQYPKNVEKSVEKWHNQPNVAQD
jgi:tRNA dimethylallyltransferase